MNDEQNKMTTDALKPGILIADDNQAILKYLKAMLSTYGFKTTLAENGAEAVTLFDKDAHSIVLTDIEMPKMNGLQLLEKIKKISPKTPVIIMTGHSHKYDKQHIHNAGCSDLLIKPFSKTKLVDILWGLPEMQAKKNDQIYHEAV